MNSLFPEVIDKLFVFYNSSNDITFVLPTINFDFLFVMFLVIITLSTVFDMFLIFFNHWRKK